MSGAERDDRADSSGVIPRTSGVIPKTSGVSPRADGFDGSGDGSSGTFATLDDSIEEVERTLTMAELKAKHGQQGAGEGGGTSNGFVSASRARLRARDDELLDDPPATDHHLGRLAGWRATRKSRWIVGIVLALAVLAGIIAFVVHNRELRHASLHPMPGVEATITPGTPREMTYANGKFRIAISRDAPAVNLVHLPDRDITLGRWAEKAQFKVEIRDGKTVKLDVLTGDIVETLTSADAKPLLEDD